MGWAGGSAIMTEVILAVKANVPAFSLRERIYVPIIAAFDAQDWDTQTECLDLDPAFDDALQVAHPDMFDEDDEEDAA